MIQGSPRPTRLLCGRSFVYEGQTAICQRTTGHEGECGPAPLVEVLDDQPSQND